MKQNKHKNSSEAEHTYDQALFEWHAPEYHKYPKGRLWFILASVALVGFVIYGVFTSGWTFSIAMLVFAGVYLLIHSEEPRRIPVKISHIGIKIGNLYIPYSHIRTFWIVYHPPFVKTINFRTTNAFMPDIMVSLEDEHPVPIREYIATQIPEWEGKGEHFSNILVRLLRL